MKKPVDTTPIPDHPVGSLWLWKGSGDEPDETMIVVKVTKRTVKMQCRGRAGGWSVTFMDKARALRSGVLVRLPDEEPK